MSISTPIRSPCASRRRWIARKWSSQCWQKVRSSMVDRIDHTRLAQAIREKQNGRSMAAISRESGAKVQTLKCLLAGEELRKDHGALFVVIGWLGIEPRTFLIVRDEEE